MWKVTTGWMFVFARALLIMTASTIGVHANRNEITNVVFGYLNIVNKVLLFGKRYGTGSSVEQT